MANFIKLATEQQSAGRLILLCNFLSAGFLVAGGERSAGRAALPDFFSHVHCFLAVDGYKRADSLGIFRR